MPLRDAARGEAAALAPVRFIDGLSELVGRYDLILCDIWGVLHNGLSAFPGASAALCRFREAGGHVILVSNAPRPGRVVLEQLDGYGVSRAAYDDIRTSGDLTRDIVASRLGRPFHHVGPERDLGLFEGLPISPSSLAEADYVVCTGLFDDEIETVEHYHDTLRAMRVRDLEMICANPDIVVERGHRLILCAGALGVAYEQLGGRTTTPGKPYPPIYEAALALGRTLAGRDLPGSRVLAVGDAIRTDVTGGHGAGLDTLLVARGIHAADLGVTDIGLDRAVTTAWVAGQPVRPTLAIHALVW